MSSRHAKPIGPTSVCVALQEIFGGGGSGAWLGPGGKTASNWGAALQSAGGCAAGCAGINGASPWLRLYETPPIGWHTSSVKTGLASAITTTPVSIGNPPAKIATINVEAISPDSGLQAGDGLRCLTHPIVASQELRFNRSRSVPAAWVRPTLG